jgi:hypothetical protein
VIEVIDPTDYLRNNKPIPKEKRMMYLMVIINEFHQRRNFFFMFILIGLVFGLIVGFVLGKVI